MTDQLDLPATEPVSIQMEIADCLNYASWQNSVPLLKALAVRNNTTEAISNLKLSVQSSPGFIRPKQWVIDARSRSQSI